VIDKQLKKYLLALVVLALLLGVWIVPVEFGHKVNNLNDGLWWAITTVTGVGYGDVVPVTGAGSGNRGGADDRRFNPVFVCGGTAVFAILPGRGKISPPVPGKNYGLNQQQTLPSGKETRLLDQREKKPIIGLLLSIK